MKRTREWGLVPLIRCHRLEQQKAPKGDKRMENPHDNFEHKV